MKRMILLFSHRLTPKQIEDAKERFGIKTFVYLPKHLQAVWSGLDPKEASIKGQLKPILDYIRANTSEENIFLVQGDFGAVFIAVSLIKSLGMKAYYSTTKRVYNTVHLDKGLLKNTHLFSHEIFREYEDL